MTRVCHLIDFNRDTAYFRAIARHHDRARFPVLVGSLEEAGPLQRAMASLGTPTFALDAGGGWGGFPAAQRLAALLREQAVGVVHAHCFFPTLWGLAAARLAGVPFVFTRHHSDHHLRLGKRWHTRLDGWSARRAARAIAVSEATRRIMVEREGVPDERITVVWNGMDALPPPSPASVQALRLSLGLRESSPVCLLAARLHEEKGHAVLLRALPAVLRSVTDLVVLCAGDGPHRAALERETAERGLAAHVRFLGQRGDVPALLALSSLAVLPSLAESFGFAALEAMSLGRAVVASRAGGLPEVVADGETGLLADVGDVDGLASALTALLVDPARREAMGAAGRARAALFTSERMVRGYEAVYDGL
ncbi:MAG: glycosyltransferase family 4 protein [Vicinamibacteria bacterium]